MDRKDTKARRDSVTAMRFDIIAGQIKGISRISNKGHASFIKSKEHILGTDMKIYASGRITNTLKGVSLGHTLFLKTG